MVLHFILAEAVSRVITSLSSTVACPTIVFIVTGTASSFAIVAASFLVVFAIATVILIFNTESVVHEWVSIALITDDAPAVVLKAVEAARRHAGLALGSVAPVEAIASFTG